MRREQQDVAHRHVQKLPRRFHHEVDVHDDRIVEARINPDPTRLIGNQFIERQLELARARDVIALAPKIKLVNANDENDAEHEVDEIIQWFHSAIRLLFQPAAQGKRK